METRSEQELFWEGEFGDEYTKRNNSEKILINNIALFQRILNKVRPIHSVLEFGANIGLNLQAMKILLPMLSYAAVEINKSAINILKKNDWMQVYEQSLLTYQNNETYDFVMVKGVLIHIHPQDLAIVYEHLYAASNRYILIAEYYHPQPMEMQYRGHANKLFKRDFAGEMLDKFPLLKLIDYGFSYHRDPSFPQDDITWFLLEKDFHS